MAETKTDPKPFPTSIVLTILCGLISAVYLYLQLRVWKEEGHDHMLTAINIFVTIILWITLFVCIYLNRKDRRRAEYFLGEIVMLKDEHRLKVEDLQRQLASRPPILPWGGHRSAEEQRSIADEQNRLLNLGRAVDGLLVPLQVDSLRLAKKVLQFMSDTGKRPEVDGSQFMRDANGNPKDYSIVIQEHMAATNRVLLPWIAQTRSTFKTDLLPELEAISLRYGKLGIGVDLVPHSEEYLLTNRWLFDVSFDLVKLAHGIDTMKVVPILDKA